MFKNIKRNILWYHFLKFIIYPVYHFFWTYFLNFKGKILYLLWFSKKREYFTVDKKHSVKEIRDNPIIKKLSEDIFTACNKEVLNKSIDEINEFTEDRKNLSNDGENKYIAELFQKIDPEAQNKIFQFCSSELMLSTAAKYLGIFPVFSKIALTLHIPRNIDLKRGAMMFHKDEYGFKSLDIFISINDIDLNNGPLKAVKTKYDDIGPLARISNEDSSNLRGNRGKILDSEIDKKKIDELSIMGPKGTALLIDSYKCYHAGGHCLKNNRLLLRILYSSADDTTLKDPNFLKENYLFFKNNDNLNNIFFLKNFFFRRSKIFMNKKFGNLLFKFFRLISFRY